MLLGTEIAALVICNLIPNRSTLGNDVDCRHTDSANCIALFQTTAFL
nr:hypothetical protein [Luteimonas gilva]